MNKGLLLPALLLCALLPLYAGNSIFSYDGYPVQFYGNDIYSLGMGDAGASDVFRNNTGYGNPAMHNASNRSLFATGILLGYNAYQSLDAENRKSSFVDNSLDLPYFSLSLPIKKHRLGFQFSSFASGVVTNQREFLAPDSTTITEEQEMDRYLYRADLIYSVNLGRHNLGISGNYYLGHEVRNFSQDGDFGLYDTEEEVARSYKNPSVTLGYLLHYEKWAVGASYSIGARLTGQEIRSSIHEEEDPVDYEYKLPAQAALSVTVLPKPEFKLAADFRYEPWSGIDADKYVDSWKVGLGAAYEPIADNHQQALLKLPLRAGISYRMLPFLVNDNEVEELALTFGVSFPLKGDANRIDVGFQYTNRGNLEKNLLRDNSFLMMFGFTGFDILGKAPDRSAPREIPEKEDIEPW